MVKRVHVMDAQAMYAQVMGDTYVHTRIYSGHIRTNTYIHTQVMDEQVMGKRAPRPPSQPTLSCLRRLPPPAPATTQALGDLKGKEFFNFLAMSFQTLWQ